MYRLVVHDFVYL